jgi:hypothetical protein
MKHDRLMSYEQMRQAVHERSLGRGSDISSEEMFSSLGFDPDGVRVLAADMGQAQQEKASEEPLDEALAVSFLMGFELGAMLAEVAIRVQLMSDGRSLDS